jgi:23S rRNA-/tRNA-specific pseudouridylate synthase
LGEFNTIEDYLLTLEISKSQIKKSKLSKNFLEKNIKSHEEIEIPINIINKGIINPFYRGPKIEIIFEDKNILCVNKPYNIHCFPLSYDENNNVLSFLRENLYFKKTNFCFERKYEGGLLYRLDYETSGVLFFCKNLNQYLEVRKNFNNLAKTKEYICIVKGKFEKNGFHKHKFSSFGPNKRKVRIDDKGELGEGTLEVSILAYNSSEDLTFLKIKLFTGIRHQIRTQLSFLGFPILGDVLYGGEPSERIFLHAYRYCILIDGKNYMIQTKNALFFHRFFDLDSIL